MIMAHAFDQHPMLSLPYLVSQDHGQVLIIGLPTRQAGRPLSFGGTGAVKKRVRGVGIEGAQQVDDLLPGIVRHQRLWGLGRHIGIGRLQAIFIVVEATAARLGKGAKPCSVGRRASK